MWGGGKGGVQGDQSSWREMTLSLMFSPSSRTPVHLPSSSLSLARDIFV